MLALNPRVNGTAWLKDLCGSQEALYDSEDCKKHKSAAG